ncbi:MAG TPA: hypothetical protein DDZ80_26620 [Cyanobacteria bacterium UBA8803]|nr:hypothetical protein [Cyanobacteria bacterium UBA9273]HBL61854.1 hypothetical protein [Cyanobacteria bacterium UBA8803]
MLPLSKRQEYQEFQQALEQLHSRIDATDLEIVAIKAAFQDVKQLFTSQIANLSAEEIAPDNASRWQSIQTEIHKQMRLLETEMLRLQAARSSATSKARASGISDRLKILIQYCEALL